MSVESPLSRLIDKEDLLGKYWNRKHAVFKGAVPVEGFLDENAIQQLFDMGLLRWPYFTLLKEGVQPERSAMTRARNVGGQDVQDFADAQAVRDHLAKGATLKLSQLEDWHLPTRNMMREIETRLPAELKAYMFYTPCDNSGMLPHRDGSHVLAVQISGEKEWRLYAAPGQIDARSGLDVDADRPTDAFIMEPGDVLYLPHGYPHAATARGGTSLHLTFTITEPTPLDLVESLLSTFADSSGYLLERHYRMRLEDKADAVIKALLYHLECVDSQALVDTALRQMRQRTV